MKTHIESIQDVKDFFNELKQENVSFHPDDDFTGYIGISTEKGELMNEVMDKCFSVCEANKVDIYEIALEYQQINI